MAIDARQSSSKDKDGEFLLLITKQGSPRQSGPGAGWKLPPRVSAPPKRLGSDLTERRRVTW